MGSLFWFRRDLRLNDNVALNEAIRAAIADGDARVCGFYSVDLSTFEQLEGIRQWSLHASLNALGASMNRKLVIRHGKIAETIVATAVAASVKEVFATRAFDPIGVAEQNEAGLALKKVGIGLKLFDSNYAVPPGKVTKSDGTPYRVYTPFFRAWFDLAPD